MSKMNRIDKNTLENAAITVEELNTHQVGKLALCRADEGRSRMYVSSFSKQHTKEKKQGRWEMFTVTRKTLKHSGYYICQITKFKRDKNGFPNMHVEPILYVGNGINEEDVVWRMLIKSGEFSDMFISAATRDLSGLNIDAVYDLMNKKGIECEDGTLRKAAEAILDYVVATTDISVLQQLNTALLTPSTIEVIGQTLLHNSDEYADDYPRLVYYFRGWLDNKRKSSVLVKVSDAVEFVNRRLNEYIDREIGSLDEGLSELEMLEAVHVQRDAEKEERVMSSKMSKLSRKYSHNKAS